MISVMYHSWKNSENSHPSYILGPSSVDEELWQEKDLYKLLQIIISPGIKH